MDIDARGRPTLGRKGKRGKGGDKLHASLGAPKRLEIQPLAIPEKRASRIERKIKDYFAADPRPWAAAKLAKMLHVSITQAISIVHARRLGDVQPAGAGLVLIHPNPDLHLDKKHVKKERRSRSDSEL